MSYSWGIADYENDQVSAPAGLVVEVYRDDPQSHTTFWGLASSSSFSWRGLLAVPCQAVKMISAGTGKGDIEV